jgi:catechol 2,3-dioxygenase-like lactoylglutathione lyase family enzyme
MRIAGLDHLVLTVRNIEVTAAFYERVLGMERAMFGEGRVCLTFADQKINLHQSGREFAPRALVPTPGSGDLCFVIETPLVDAMAHVQACGVEITEGPVPRAGARGPFTSFYCRDPDGNLLEISAY